MIHILLIDQTLDEPKSVRKSVRKSVLGLVPALDATQFAIYLATDDQSMLEALGRNDFDVCLIDSILGDGLKFVGRLRSLGRKLPIIMVTSNNAGELLAAMRSGLSDCLIRDQMTSAGVASSVWSVVNQDRAVALIDQRERRYLALFDNSDAAIFTCDLYGQFTSINRAGENLMGFTEDETLKQNLFGVVAPEHLLVVHNAMQQAVDAQRRFASRIVLINKEGRRLSVEICAHPVCRDGRTVELQVVARNVPNDESRLFGKLGNTIHELTRKEAGDFRVF